MLTADQSGRAGFGLANLASGFGPSSRAPSTATADASSRRSCEERTRYANLPPVKLLDFGVSQVCVDAVDPESGERRTLRTLPDVVPGGEAGLLGLALAMPVFALWAILG